MARRIKKATQAQVEEEIRRMLGNAGPRGVWKQGVQEVLDDGGISRPLQRKALNAMLNRGEVRAMDTDEEWTLDDRYRP